jgi:hypothetical protein
MEKRVVGNVERRDVVKEQPSVPAEIMTTIGPRLVRTMASSLKRVHLLLDAIRMTFVLYDQYYERPSECLGDC